MRFSALSMLICPIELWNVVPTSTKHHVGEQPGSIGNGTALATSQVKTAHDLAQLRELDSGPEYQPEFPGR